MKHYGDDVPPRLQVVEDLHARDVWIQGEILKEFKAVFNIASAIAEELQRVAPDNPFVGIARLEGMLGRFDVQPGVQQEVEEGKVRERPRVPAKVQGEGDGVPCENGEDPPPSEAVRLDEGASGEPAIPTGEQV